MKILKVILIIVAAIAALLAVLILTNAPANKKAMNSAVDTFIDAVSEKFTVTEADCGEYKTMKVYGVMKFNVRRFDVEEIGSLSVMTTNMGLMQMATVVLTPAERDIPLVSMDYMYMLGNRKSYLEFYDLVTDKEGSYKELLTALKAVKDKYGDLEDVVPTAAWYDELKTVGIYKAGKKADDAKMNQILADGVAAVMEYALALPVLEGEQRAEKVSLQKTYSNGLIENGGVSTDAFVGSLGADATRAFFDEVLFRAE